MVTRRSVGCLRIEVIPHVIEKGVKCFGKIVSFFFLSFSRKKNKSKNVQPEISTMAAAIYYTYNLHIFLVNKYRYVWHVTDVNQTKFWWR